MIQNHTTRFITEVTNWLFNYVIVLLVFIFSLYVYINWVAPWSVIYGILLLAYLIKAVDHYTDPRNYSRKYDGDDPVSEYRLEDNAFQQHEDEYNRRNGLPLDDQDRPRRF